MKEVKALVIKGLHHWGFSIRVPLQSAAGKSYPVPPPSTIIGALAKPYCINEVGYSTNNSLSCVVNFIRRKILAKELKWVTYGLIKGAAVPYSDLGRELRSPYRQSGKRTIKESFGVAAFGKTYSPSSVFVIIAVLDDQANDEEWVKLGWQMTSLGSKESIVTIMNVSINNLEQSKGELRNVITYFPTSCVKSISGLQGIENLELPILNNYKLVNTIQALTQVMPYMDYFLVPKQSLIYGGGIKINESLIKCDSYGIKDCPECGDLIMPSTMLSELAEKLMRDYYE